MKLLFCIKAMNNPGGGAEKVLAQVTEGLLHRGHDIAILSYDLPGGQSFYPLNSKIIRIEIGIGSTTERAAFFVTIKRIAALRSKVLEYDPDVVIGFMHSMFIPLGFSLLGTFKPLVASEHIVPEHYRSRPLEALLLSFTPFLAKKITCVTEQVKESYPYFLQRNMVSVANPLCVNVHKKAYATGLPGERKILLTVGRLEPQKDHETLIESFAMIAKDLPSWNLRIAGDGALRQKLEKLVSQKGLSARVSFAGTVKNIDREYLSAQLFVQPSRYESFGLTTAEALAYGLPAIGFDDCQGTNQLIQPGINGELANGRGNRPVNLAEKLKKIMADDGLRACLSSAADVPDEWRLGNVVLHWERLLFELAGNRI